MVGFEILEVLQQNIKDLKSLLMDENLPLTGKERKRLERGLVLNLEDHLQELISKI